MAITKNDLILFKEDKLKELEVAKQEEKESSEQIEYEVEKLRKELEERHQLFKVKPLERINAEIEILDTLIKKAEEKETLEELN